MEMQNLGADRRLILVVSSLKRNQLNGNWMLKNATRARANSLFTEEKPIEWK